MPDFNGDGRDDILWYDQYAGTISNWLGREDGGFVINDAAALNQIEVDGNQDWDWEPLTTGDFNGDGRDDILWASDDHQLSDWLGTETGGFIVNDSNALTDMPWDWSLWGVGDFNGDGADDLLWFNGGALATWSGTLTGGFTKNPPTSPTVPQQGGWNMVGFGDFDGDGRDDILWRNVFTGAVSDWLANEDGTFTVNDANAWHDVSPDWQIAGIGDFDGDGHDDILWTNDLAGRISNWLGTEGGGFIINDANALAVDPIDWVVVGVGDYNGDGYDDILWAGQGGALSNWLGTATGGWLVNDAAALATVDQSWNIGPFNDLYEWWDL